MIYLCIRTCCCTIAISNPNFTFSDHKYYRVVYNARIQTITNRLASRRNWDVLEQIRRCLLESTCTRSPISSLADNLAVYWFLVLSAMCNVCIGWHVAGFFFVNQPTKYLSLNYCSLCAFYDWSPNRDVSLERIDERRMNATIYDEPHDVCGKDCAHVWSERARRFVYADIHTVEAIDFLPFGILHIPFTCAHRQKRAVWPRHSASGWASQSDTIDGIYCRAARN